MQKDLTESKALSVAQKTLGVQPSNLENYGVKDRVENPVNSEDANCSLGKRVFDSFLKFNHCFLIEIKYRLQSNCFFCVSVKFFPVV